MLNNYLVELYVFARDYATRSCIPYPSRARTAHFAGFPRRHG